MTDYQLDPRPFFQILHNLVHHEDLGYDHDQAVASTEWYEGRAQMLRKILSASEFGVIHEYWLYWRKHKAAPTVTALNDLIRAKPQAQGKLDVLEGYKKYRDDLEVVPVTDLFVSLDQRQLDYEKYKLARVLDNALKVNIVGLQMDEGRQKVQRSGPRDAINYLHGEFQRGILLTDTPTVGGALSKTADKIAERYAQAESEARKNNLFIPTGISLIDTNLGGLRRKELNGILGFVGQRKSGIARTIAYNAAARKFRVLHIPLESDYEEEESIYAVMHAQKKLAPVSKSRLDRALLTPEEKKVFLEVIVPNYKQEIADRILVYTPGVSRSWEDVKAIIERETAHEQIDLVIIDYLTMLSTPGNRDDIADKIAIIQDAKRLAMTANDGKGLCILTPIQGNRNGYDAAGANDGAWSTTGIAKYSELDKSMDNIFFCYFDNEMNQENKMKFGSCKTRRAANIAASFIHVDPQSGMVSDDSKGKTETVTPGAPKGAAQGPDQSMDGFDNLVAMAEMKAARSPGAWL